MTATVTMFATEVRVLRCSRCGMVMDAIPVYCDGKFDDMHYRHPRSPLMASPVSEVCQFVGRVFELHWPASAKLTEVTR